MRIKKVKKNEYILAHDIWVRNFTKTNISSFSINNLCSHDQELLIENELKNITEVEAYSIDEEKFNFPFVVLMSDGFEFKEKQNLLSSLPKDIVIFSVNRSLAKWKLMSNNIRPDLRRSINFYIVNNPYADCMSYLPKENNYYPSCIFSTRTYPEFAKKYYGNKYLYYPTPERSYGGNIDEGVRYYVDDYRNPICAGIVLASKMKVRRLLLFCCDDSFKDERPGAEKLDNGLWQYPQHNISHDIIDANLYWLSHQQDYPVKIGNFSSGKDYVNAPYIKADKIMEFFTV